MKPLYIDGNEARHVSLDGPALKVQQPSCAALRFPLARISRVVASGGVSWSTEALLACADAGIVVCFLHANGRPRARWIGRPASRSTFSQHWRDFLDRPDWAERYGNWRTNLRRHAIGFCTMRLGFPHGPLRDLPSMVTPDASEAVPFGRAKSHIYGLAYARALDELATLGLGSGDPSLRTVAPDLAICVQWGLHPDLVAWQRDHGWPTERQQATVFFERHRPTAEFHLRHALRCLSRFLEGVV